MSQDRLDKFEVGDAVVIEAVVGRKSSKGVILILPGVGERGGWHMPNSVIVESPIDDERASDIQRVAIAQLAEFALGNGE